MCVSEKHESDVDCTEFEECYGRVDRRVVVLTYFHLDRRVTKFVHYSLYIHKVRTSYFLTTTYNFCDVVYTGLTMCTHGMIHLQILQPQNVNFHTI